MKKISTLFITSLSIITIFTAPQALAQESSSNIFNQDSSVSIVNQGDKVTNIKHSCTINYVDSTHRRAYTAQHCFNNGDTVYTRDHKTKLGVNYHFDNTVKNDVSYILLDKNITAGHNIYSGDTISRSWNNGDTVYNYSRKRSQTFNYPVINGSDNPVVTPTRNLYYRKGTKTSLPGDSGGPIWTDNGLIGVHGGSNRDEKNNIFFSAFPSDDVINKLPDGEHYSPVKKNPTIKSPHNPGSLSSLSSLSSF